MKAKRRDKLITAIEDTILRVDPSATWEQWAVVLAYMLHEVVTEIEKHS